MIPGAYADACSDSSSRGRGDTPADQHKLPRRIFVSFESLQDRYSMPSLYSGTGERKGTDTGTDVGTDTSTDVGTDAGTDAATGTHGAMN